MLKSSEIKKSVLGLLLSDGYIDYKNRFSISSKYPEFRNHCAVLFDSFPNSKNKIWINDYYDKRFDVYTYKLVVNYPAYFKSFREMCYEDEVKILNKKSIDKIDLRCLAYIWMGDGYLEHAKNRKKDKVQNLGWFCLESFSFESLELMSNTLNAKYNLTLKTVISNTGRGKSPRLKIQGEGLQRMISLLYPFVTPTFQYKTKLFYKTDRYFDHTLPNAEHIFTQYNTIKEYEDIVGPYRKL